MPKIDGGRVVLDFIAKLPPKHAAQIAKRVLALGIDPRPHDSSELEGFSRYRRADVGEYRIVYIHSQSEDLVTVILVGRRNDDDVYRRLRRLMA